MAEGTGSSNTAIWVAVITVVGSIVTAIIVNADRWISRTDAPAAVAAPAAATPVPSGPAAPGAAVAPAQLFSEGPQVAAAPAAAPLAEAGPSAPAIVAGPVDLGGAWRDDDGSLFSFDQTGTRYELTQTSISGNAQLYGRGTIAGRDLSYDFELMTGETGTCTARINAAGNRITGRCVYADGGWTYVIER